MCIRDRSILYNYGNEKIKTTSTGVSITGNNVVSGNVTAVDGTFSGALDVDGHTELDDLKVTGVSTLSSAIVGTAVTINSTGIHAAAGIITATTFKVVVVDPVP